MQVERASQGKATAAAECFFGVGTMLGPTIGGALHDLGGFPLPFWVRWRQPSQQSTDITPVCGLRNLTLDLC